MKILFINEVCGITSTGRIVCELADELTEQGNECKIAFGRNGIVPDKWKHYSVRIGTDFDVKCHALITRVFDKSGFGSKKATKKFVQWLDKFNPDMIWLHNLHGYYINIEILFDWIKKHPDKKIKWTLHDCWSFTGHCTHYMVPKCEKWKVQCEKCPEKKRYPASLLIDNSKNNYIRKKKIFTGVKNLEIVVPSQWLADEVKKSYLGEYPVSVNYNSIDKDIFKPTYGSFIDRYKLKDKKIILGVANVWTDRKGFYDFIELSKIINEKYIIVLVGVSDKQIEELPSNIIGIKRTHNANDLAEIYTAATVFFNPTYEDNYPTVNLEAEACGTRVITYRTGGAPETIKREDSIVLDIGAWNEILDKLA